MGQQWFGETEGSPWDSLQSLPGLRGWEGLWDSSGMVGLMGWEGLWDSSGKVGLRGVSGTPFSPRQDSGDGKDCGTAVVWWDLGESLGLPSVPARTHEMGRTVGQQWYGGTEGSHWDSLQSQPGLRGWEGLWDSSGLVGLRGVSGTPFSPRQDSGDGEDFETAVVWWD